MRLRLALPPRNVQCGLILPRYRMRFHCVGPPHHVMPGLAVGRSSVRLSRSIVHCEIPSCRSVLSGITLPFCVILNSRSVVHCCAVICCLMSRRHAASQNRILPRLVAKYDVMGIRPIVPQDSKRPNLIFPPHFIVLTPGSIRSGRLFTATVSCGRMCSPTVCPSFVTMYARIICRNSMTPVLLAS
jgi:hypothetical protein